MRRSVPSRSLLAGSAIATLISATAVAAENAPAPARSSTAVSWSGLYMGFNYGYAWTGAPGLDLLGAPLFDTTPGALWSNAAAAGATRRVDGRLGGFFGGAQIGYIWQMPGGAVVGIETDLQGAGIRGGGWFGSIAPTALPAFAALTSASVRRSLEHFGTVRARLGYSITPGLLAYLTGGFAYGGASLSGNVNQSLNPSALATGNAHIARYAERGGWTLGAGAEMAIAPNLSAKLEYLFYDLGRMTAAYPNVAPLMQRDPITGAAVATAMSAGARFTGHALRTGLNYRFGGQSASDAPSDSSTSASGPPRFGDWSVSFMPYVWTLGMNGSTTVLGHTTALNVSFVDALTKASAMPLELAANTELRNGPLSVYVDFALMQIRMAGSLLALRNPIAGASLSLDADARLKTGLAIVETGGTFEVGRWTYAGLPAGETAVDLVAGLRYWRVGLDLALDIAGAVNLANLGLTQSGGKAIARSGDLSWVDPFVGMRVRQKIDAANGFYAKADVGGFGVGSKFAWQAAGGYTHDFQFAGLNWTSMVGYRAVRANYERGSGIKRAGVDAVLHGPTAGVGLRF